MSKLRFKPISHSWVALHPEPKGVIQFIGGAFFGTFLPTLFYRHLLRYFYDKSYTIILLPFSFSFNHYKESFFLLREQYALLPELVSMAIAQGIDPAIYLKAQNYAWVGHSIGCKYISLLESASKLPTDEAELISFIGDVLEPMQLSQDAKSKLVQRLALELTELREGLMIDSQTSKKLVNQCMDNNINYLSSTHLHSKSIFDDLFIVDQKSVLIAPVASDTSSAVRPKSLAKLIDRLGWGVQPTSAVTKSLIKKADLFNLLVLAKFMSDKLAHDTIDWFYKTLDKPKASDRDPYPGGHLRPLGFTLGDVVINPWFDFPLITSRSARNQALEDRLDHELQKLQA